MNVRSDSRLRAKSVLDDLACFGGSPLFERELAVGRPNMRNTDSLMERLQDVLRRGWLTNDGPLVQEVERRFAEVLEVPHCVAVCNATIGLQVALAALGVQGEVLLPSFTFIGTAHALQWMGLRPVFCDVENDGHGLDPADVERRITTDTGAILGVHLWGRACQVESLQAIADRHVIPLVLDAAHALGCGHQGRPLGCRGAAEVFSLHATKAVNALEGGLITTTDPVLARRMRLMRNFGITAQGQVATLGINAKMSEFHAAAGLNNLEGMAALCDHNHGLFQAYGQALDGVPGMRLHAPAAGERFTYHYTVLEIESTLPIDRDRMLALLLAENVYARRYFDPGCHRSEPYLSTAQSLPVTERLSRTLLQLPTGWQLDAYDAEALGRLIAWCAHQGSAIRARLALPAA